jgi:signal transduction histidine kinase
MTAIWTLLKNPKNLLILILAIAVLTCGAVVLFQRGSLAKSAAKVKEQTVEIERYKAAQKAYGEVIDQYAEQVVKWQKLAESQQAITNQTAKEKVKIKYIKSDCKMEKDDAKIINGVADYFNTGKLRDN